MSVAAAGFYQQRRSCGTDAGPIAVPEQHDYAEHGAAPVLESLASATRAVATTGAYPRPEKGGTDEYAGIALVGPPY